MAELEIDPNREFSFSFTYAEAEYIIKRLGDAPFKDVQVVIPKMQKQFEVQIQLPQEPVPMPVAESEVKSHEEEDALEDDDDFRRSFNPNFPDDNDEDIVPAPAPED